MTGLLTSLAALLALAGAPTLHSHQKEKYADKLRTEAEDIEPPVAQPLNYRLPIIPSAAPRLLGNVNLTISASPGATVVLPCRIMDLGSATLFWIRMPELTVLTSGDVLFSSSPRLKIVHPPGSIDWNLQIADINMADSGLYECQVNTEPKLSRLVDLAVVPEFESSRLVARSGDVPALALQVAGAGGGAGGGAEERWEQRTEILAPPELRVEEGASVTLECVVTEHKRPPDYFTWYIGDKALDFHSHRGGILIQEERTTRSSASKLTLTRMEAADTETYTCSPQGADQARVRVTVLPPNYRDRSFYLSSSVPLTCIISPLYIITIIIYILLL